jgi:hypothetical protein
MINRGNILLMLKVLILFVVAIVVAFLGFAGYLATHFWWDRDQWNQQRVANAYISYYEAKTNFPASLADLVHAGYLPEKAKWYKEPPGIFPRPVNFSNSCYVVMAPKSGNVEDLKMVGRRVRHDGKEEIDFNPPINAKIRDAIRASK